MDETMNLLDEHMYVVVISVICLAILSNSLIQSVCIHSEKRLSERRFQS